MNRQHLDDDGVQGSDLNHAKPLTLRIPSTRSIGVVWEIPEGLLDVASQSMSDNGYQYTLHHPAVEPSLRFREARQEPRRLYTANQQVFTIMSDMFYPREDSPLLSFVVPYTA